MIQLHLTWCDVDAAYIFSLTRAEYGQWEKGELENSLEQTHDLQL